MSARVQRRLAQVSFGMTKNSVRQTEMAIRFTEIGVRIN